MKTRSSVSLFVFLACLLSTVVSAQTTPKSGTTTAKPKPPSTTQAPASETSSSAASTPASPNFEYWSVGDISSATPAETKTRAGLLLVGGGSTSPMPGAGSRAVRAADTSSS